MTRSLSLTLLACLALATGASACGSSSGDKNDAAGGGGGQGGSAGSAGADAGTAGSGGSAGDAAAADKAGAVSEAGAASEAGAVKLGDLSRITNSGTDWSINFTKGSIFVSVRLGDAYDTDLPARADAVAFAQVVAGKITAATTDVLTCAPAANEVAGWAYNPNAKTTTGSPVAGPVVANTQQEAVDLVDGSANPFYAGTDKPAAFGWANYLNTTKKNPDGNDYRLAVQIVKMATPAAASQLYADLLKNSLFRNNVWTDL